MAIEKNLNTSLKLSYDRYENGITNDPVLLAGEIALATVTVKQDGVVNEVPSVLIKVGDGVHKYSELDYAYAKAADVIEQAKSAEKLTAFINNVIANAGIATDEALTNLSGRVTTAEGKITALEPKVGDAAVATQISNAIEALKLAETYATNEYVDGKLGNVGEDKGTVTARINAIEEELAAAVTFEPISENEIVALFA